MSTVETTYVVQSMLPSSTKSPCNPVENRSNLVKSGHWEVDPNPFTGSPLKKLQSLSF